MFADFEQVNKAASRDFLNVVHGTFHDLEAGEMASLSAYPIL